ncbi:MAG TPA: hypothetical protein VND91_12960 [Candidatus Saccharimonadia bacterium]|nr:hypothetical protein [Candidatus Saccharimonadia bacterium]
MAPRYSITLLCALAVFTIGSGIGGVTVAADRSAPVAEVYAARIADVGQRSALPVLPTVYVTASSLAADSVAPRRSGRSVMLDRAVDQAGSLFAQGTRRVGLAMPYYAFGAASRGTE